MRIVMRDGRVFEGTALQIVQAMKSTAFGAELMGVGDYVDWVLGNLERFEGLVLSAPGSADEERAEALLEALLERGLATSSREIER